MSVGLKEVNGRARVRISKLLALRAVERRGVESNAHVGQDTTCSRLSDGILSCDRALAKLFRRCLARDGIGGREDRNTCWTNSRLVRIAPTRHQARVARLTVSNLLPSHQANVDASGTRDSYKRHEFAQKRFRSRLQTA